METACTAGEVVGMVDNRDCDFQYQVLSGQLAEIRTEVSVQANDYEIERATGCLPARKRCIPYKYRDFRSPDEVEEDNNKDSDYEPELLLHTKESRQKRGRGRPRKYAEVKTEDGDVSKKPLMMRTSSGYKCLTCNKVFSQKGNLKVHLNTHTDYRPWQCEVQNCNKAFRTKESLRRHKLSHMGIKPFECSECKKKFCSALSLQEHMSRHSNEKPYSCHECQRSFRQVSCLRRHLLTHSSATPHTCHMCGRKFSQAIYLRSHLKVHTGEKPFTCEQCNKSFAHASDLTRHKIIHSGLKPYNCSVCSMQFNDPSSRRRHEREHLGTKPYACHLCTEGFKRASQLRAHLFRRHGGLKEGVEFRIQEGSDPVCYRIELHEAQSDGSEVAAAKLVDLSSIDQKKIMNLIQNLNHNVVIQEVEVATGEALDNSGLAEAQVGNVHLNDSQGTINVEQLVLPIEVASVISSEKDNSNIITIAEVNTANGSQELGPTYQILQGFQAEGEELSKQVYEVHYHSASGTDSSASETTVSDTITSTDQVPEASLDNNTTLHTVAISDANFTFHQRALIENLSAEFVTKPDFSSQEYFDWLSSFTEVCRMVSVPLDVELFQKISHVHKTLSDFMASPSGVIADKDNFKILMSISKDLSHILNDHLTCMLQNLSDGDKARVIGE